MNKRVEELISDEVIRHEKYLSHQAVMLVVHHYLNNILTNLQIIQIEIDITGTLEKPTLKGIEALIDKTARDVRDFGDLPAPSIEEAIAFIDSRL